MSTVKQWINLHPKLAAWIVLAIGWLFSSCGRPKTWGCCPVRCWRW